MKRSKRCVQVLVICACLLIHSCVAVAPAVQILVTAVVLISAYTAKTAIYQTITVTMDEVVRPYLRKLMGRPEKDLVIHPDNPLRAELYGKFEFHVKDKENEKPTVVGQVPLVRATIDSPWNYDPVYLSRLESDLGGRVTVEQK